MVYSTRRIVLSLALCYFVLVFFSPFSIAITSLGEERANLSAFRTFVQYALVFSLPLGVWERLRLESALGAYAASQTTVSHMKRLNQTESPIFVILCVLCFQRQSF